MSQNRDPDRARPCQHQGCRDRRLRLFRMMVIVRAAAMAVEQQQQNPQHDQSPPQDGQERQN